MRETILPILRFTTVRINASKLRYPATVRNNREESESRRTVRETILLSSRITIGSTTFPNYSPRNTFETTRSRNKRNGVSQWDNWILRISEENSISPPLLNCRFNGKIFTSRSGLIRREDGPIIIQRLIMILSLGRLRCVGRETANYTRFGSLLASWVSFYRIQSEDRSSCQPTKQSQEQTVDISPRRFTSLKTKPRTLRARCVPR